MTISFLRFLCPTQTLCLYLSLFSPQFNTNRPSHNAAHGRNITSSKVCHTHYNLSLPPASLRSTLIWTVSSLNNAYLSITICLVLPLSVVLGLSLCLNAENAMGATKEGAGRGMTNAAFTPAPFGPF